MDKEIIARPLIDPHLDSYKGFFDHAWCGRIFEAVRTSPLKDWVGELMLAWRSANGVHLLPWLMVESLRKFATGEAEGSLDYRASYADEVIKGVVNKIEKGMQYSLKQEQRSNLKRVVAKIEKEAAAAMKTAQEQVAFDVERYWASSSRCPSSGSASSALSAPTTGRCSSPTRTFSPTSSGRRNRRTPRKTRRTRSMWRSPTTSANRWATSAGTMMKWTSRGWSGTHWPTTADDSGKTLRSTRRGSWTCPGRAKPSCGEITLTSRMASSKLLQTTRRTCSAFSRTE